MASSEQYGFVFAVTFILIFSVLLSSVPADFQGQGKTGEPVITPIDPSMLTDFAESEPFDTTDFVPWIDIVEIYEYTLPVVGGREWIAGTNGTVFDLNAKRYFLGIVFLGQLDPMRFITLDGTDSSYTITLDEIDVEAVDGTARFDLISGITGDTGGQYIVYWNTTTYTDSEDAWDNNELYFLHGVGFSAEIDVVNLLLRLLFLQLPEVPFLINLLLIVPLWASIIYILWFLIINMIPFLGGG